MTVAKKPRTVADLTFAPRKEYTKTSDWWLKKAQRRLKNAKSRARVARRKP